MIVVLLVEWRNYIVVALISACFAINDFSFNPFLFKVECELQSP